MKRWFLLTVMLMISLPSFAQADTSEMFYSADKLYAKGYVDLARQTYHRGLGNNTNCVGGRYALSQRPVQQALEKLAGIYESGWDNNAPNYEIALNCYKALGDYADGQTMKQIGDMHYAGIGYPAGQSPDYQAAFNAYWKAVNKDDSGAKMKLGRMYMEGPYPTDSNPNQFNNEDRQRYQYALNLIYETASAPSPHPQAQFYLGKIAQNGWGCRPADVAGWGCVKNNPDNRDYGTPSNDLAKYWYQEAVKSRYGLAVVELAKIAEAEGNNISAYRWYRLAAKFGDSSVMPKMLPDCWDNAVATMPELQKDNLHSFVGLRCRESRLNKVMESVPEQEAYYKVMCGTDRGDPYKEYRQACNDELKSPRLSDKGTLAFSRFMLDEQNNPDQPAVTKALQYCANPAANPTIQRMKTESNFAKNAFSSMPFKDRCTGQCLADLYWSKLDDMDDPFWNNPDNASYQTSCAASCPDINPSCPAGGY
jgi:TPR repeat protein